MEEGADIEQRNVVWPKTRSSAIENMCVPCLPSCRPHATPLQPGAHSAFVPCTLETAH